MVTIYDGKIIGFLSADVDRATIRISNLFALNFTDDSEQFAACMAIMFKRWINEFTSICWTTIVGSMTEKVFDKIAEEFGGRIVGVKHRTGINLANEICDVKMYQVPGKRKIS